MFTLWFCSLRPFLSAALTPSDFEYFSLVIMCFQIIVLSGQKLQLYLPLINKFQLYDSWFRDQQQNFQLEISPEPIRLQVFQLQFLLFSQSPMNRQSKDLTHFQAKLDSCTHELSLLLDLIYKFPQQQRERFYDRIQLLKQNLTQLQLCAKDASPSAPLVSLEKKYQQAFIKISELKTEINACQLPVQTRKKKGLANEVPFSSESILNDSKGSKEIFKGKYDSIMQTIVQKDDEVKKCKEEVEEYRKIVKDLDQREKEAKRVSRMLERELAQARNVYESQLTVMVNLEKRVETLALANSELENACGRYREGLDEAQKQIIKLSSMLSEALDDGRLRKMEADGCAVKLAAFEEKYRFDVKSYVEREDMYRMKEKHYENKLAELEKKLEEEGEAESANKELRAENQRMKQDIKVLEAELASKQQHLYDKNRKIESTKAQLLTLRGKQEEQQRQLQRREHHVQQLLIAEKENQDVILMLERKIKEMERELAEREEARMMTDRRVRGLDQELGELRGKLERREEELIRVEKLLQQKSEYLARTASEKQKIEKEVEKSQLELVKSEKKLEQITKIVAKAQEQRSKLLTKSQQEQNELKDKDQSIKLYQKQIESLKKRLLRAKIETIHNIREVIV